MSENKNSMVSTAMNYAIPLGLFWIFKYLFVIGGEYVEISKYINSILGIGTPVITYVLICNYRDRNKGGNITYGEGILFILLIFGLASMIEAVITSLHLLVINPGLVTQMNEEIYNIFSKMNLPDLYMSQLDSVLSYGGIYYIVSFIVQNMIIGLFLALVLGYFASRQRNNPHQNI